MSPKKSVLIVDDDEAIREGLETLLVDEGYEVQTVENGQAALDRLRSGPLPALILLDLMMPVMGGETFCEERKKFSELASIPVILLTAGAITAKIAALDVAEMLRKPVDIDRLLEVLRRYA